MKETPEAPRSTSQTTSCTLESEKHYSVLLREAHNSKQIMNPPKACSTTSNQCPWTERYRTGASVTTVSLFSRMTPVKNRRRASAMYNHGWLWSCHLPWCHARTSGRNHTGLVKGPWASLSSPRKQSTSVTSPISQIVGALVSSGCYYKNHRQGVLNNRNVSISQF